MLLRKYNVTVSVAGGIGEPMTREERLLALLKKQRQDDSKTGALFATSASGSMR
jgi:hypothetical protein